MHEPNNSTVLHIYIIVHIIAYCNMYLLYVAEPLQFHVKSVLVVKYVAIASYRYLHIN